MKNILMAAFATSALGISAAPSTQAANLVQTGVLEGSFATALLPGAPWDPRPHRVTFKADLSTVSYIFLSAEMFHYFEIVLYQGPGAPPIYHAEGYESYEDYSTNLTPTGFSFTFDTPDNANCNPYNPDSYFCDHKYLDSFYLDLTTTAGPIEYTYKITAIPEPSTWALAIIGFGLAGAVLRRPPERGHFDRRADPARRSPPPPPALQPARAGFGGRSPSPAAQGR